MRLMVQFAVLVLIYIVTVCWLLYNTYRLMCRITEASHRPSSLKTSSPVPSGTVAPSEGTSSAKNPSSDISGIIGALKQLNMKVLTHWQAVTS